MSETLKSSFSTNASIGDSDFILLLILAVYGPKSCFSGFPLHANLPAVGELQDATALSKLYKSLYQLVSCSRGLFGGLFM
ncbi:MAG TPA: hypothetical protein DEG92_01615 [Rikenellaceae bacterium]|nr:hypothetical protein [Rikenellaceae bacterium]